MTEMYVWSVTIAILEMSNSGDDSILQLQWRSKTVKEDKNKQAEGRGG